MNKMRIYIYGNKPAMNGKSGKMLKCIKTRAKFEFHSTKMRLNDVH